MPIYIDKDAVSTKTVCRNRDFKLEVEQRSGHRFK